MSVLFLSILLFSMTAPLMISTLMVIICLFSGGYSFLLVSDPWCSLIFLMIFFGGLLVLFVYISSLATNEILSPNLFTIILLSPLTLLFNSYEMMVTHVWKFQFPQGIFLFNSDYYLMSIALMAYLLLALIIVSFITFFHFGALRQNFVNTS